VGAQQAGTFAPGDQFTVEECQFAPGSTVTLSVNGQPAGSQTADGRGCVSQAVTVLTCSSVSVNGHVLSARVGQNSLTASGSSSTGTPVVQTVNFNVACATAAGLSQQVAQGRSSTGFAFTGANVARLGAFALLLMMLGAFLVRATRDRRVRAR
jgi:hypothetical protein